MAENIRYVFYRIISVVDPQRFQCRSGSSLFRSMRIRFQGFDNKQIVKLYGTSFLSKFAIFVILRPPWRTSKLQEKPSALRREHQTGNFTFFYFCGSFLRLRSGSGSSRQKNECRSTRIWIHNTEDNQRAVLQNSVYNAAGVELHGGWTVLYCYANKQ